MTSEILNIVIDERKNLSGIDSTTLMNLGREATSSQAVQKRVFKDYILSSEVFYVEQSMN